MNGDETGRGGETGSGEEEKWCKSEYYFSRDLT